MSAPTLDKPRSKRQLSRGNFELYSWMFMRVSAIILIFLVLGHLFIMNILDGGVHHAHPLSEPPGIAVEVFGTERIPFDRGDVSRPGGRRRQGKQPDTRIQVDHAGIREAADEGASQDGREETIRLEEAPPLALDPSWR